MCSEFIYSAAVLKLYSHTLPCRSSSPMSWPRAGRGRRSPRPPSHTTGRGGQAGLWLPGSWLCVPGLGLRCSLARAASTYRPTPPGSTEPESLCSLNGLKDLVHSEDLFCAKACASPLEWSRRCCEEAQRIAVQEGFLYLTLGSALGWWVERGQREDAGER